MHARLATLATKNEGYDRALQLLARAQALGPFHAVPDMEVISLVSRRLLHCAYADDSRYVAGGLTISCLLFVGKSAKYSILLGVSMRRWSHSRQ